MSRRFGIVSKTCDGADRSIYEYAKSSRPDADSRAPCPVCGKVVKLMRIGPRRGVIPTHNRSVGQRLVAKATGSAA